MIIIEPQIIRLKAGFALAIFAFNNTAQQFAIQQAGGLELNCFEQFLLSSDEFQRATAAFQVRNDFISETSILFTYAILYFK